jgi:uncharacterized iron-regulated membrane protein
VAIMLVLAVVFPLVGASLLFVWLLDRFVLPRVARRTVDLPR